MTKFKSHIKQIVLVLAFLVMAFVFAINPFAISSNVAVAGEPTPVSVDFNAIQLLKENSVIDLSNEDKTDDNLSIPLLTGSKVPTDYIIRVIDGSGVIHDCEIKSDKSTTEYFEYEESNQSIRIKSLNSGYYKVMYGYEESGKYYFSSPVSVYVKSVKYTLTFVAPNGAKDLVPSQAGDGAKITLPNAYVQIAGTDDYLTSGVEEEYVTVAPTIYKNGAKIYDPTAEENDNPEVSLEDKKCVLTANLNGKYSATYRVKYEYLGGENNANDEFSINVMSDFDAPTELTIDKNLAMPAMALGQKGIELPNVTANTNKSTNVDYTIKKIEITKRENSNIKLVLEDNQRTFDLLLSNFENAKSYKDLTDDYKITYYIESYYGLTASATFNVTGVTLPSNSLDVSWAYTYDLPETVSWEKDSEGLPVLKKGEDVAKEVVVDSENVNKDYIYEFAPYYGYAELRFPAIFAEGIYDYDEYVFIRYFQSNTNSLDKFYIDNIKLNDDETGVVAVKDTEEGYNASNDPNIGKMNKVVRFKFNTNYSGFKLGYYTGKDYSLVYQVFNKTTGRNYIITQRKTLYESGTRAYKFKVLERALAGNVAGDETEGVSKNLTVSLSLNEDTIAEKSSFNTTVVSKDDVDANVRNALFLFTESGDAATVTAEAFEKDIKAEIAKLLLQEKDASWGNVNKEHGGSLEGDETTPDYSTNYFDNFKTNVLYNDNLVSALSKYNNITRMKEVSNGEFEVAFEKADDEKFVHLVAVAINDNNTVAIDFKTLSVDNTSEKDAPTAKVTAVEGEDDITNNNKTFYITDGAPKDIALPTVSFEDTTDKTLNISLQYYVISQEDLDAISEDELGYPAIRPSDFEQVVGKKTTVKDGVFTISNAKISASKAGTYYVVYTARDSAGNTTYFTYTFTVENIQSPKLTSINVKGATLSGGIYEADINSVVRFDYKVENEEGDITSKADTTIEIVGVKTGVEPDSYAGGYKFTVADDYKVTIKSTYQGKDMQTRTSNTKELTIRITVPALAWSGDVNVEAQKEVGEDVWLEYLSASHGNTDLDVEVTLEVTDPDYLPLDHGAPKLETKEIDNRLVTFWHFKLNDGFTDERVSEPKEGGPEYVASSHKTSGTYHVTYKAKSLVTDEEIEKEFDIKVGDSIKPEIRFGEGVVARLSQDIVYDGENRIEYNIDLKRGSTRTLVISIYSNGEQIDSIDTGLKLYDNDGTKTDAEIFNNWYNLSVTLEGAENLERNTDTTLDSQYFITGTGKFTLKFTLTDNNKNETIREISFNVVSKTAEEKHVSDSVVGTVLIVISLLILAGVILFFAFTGKKGGSGKSNKAKTTKSTKAKEKESEPEAESDAKSGDVE